MNDYFRCERSEPAGYAIVDQSVELKMGDQYNAKGTPVEMERTITQKLIAPYANAIPQIGFNENQFDFQYQENIIKILEEGESRTDRTGVNTYSLFGDVSHKVDLRLGFPGTTLKRLAFHANKVETMDWMLKGKFDLKTLKDKGVRIWDQNVKAGTEVYEGAPLELFQRLIMLNEGQRTVMNDFMEEIGVPFVRTEEGGRDFQLSERDKAQTYAIEAKLNNWGIPEKALSDGYLGPIYGKQWRNWEDVRIIPADEVTTEHWNKWNHEGCFEYDDRINDSPVVTHQVFSRSIDQVADLEKAVKNRSDSRRIILTGWNVAQLDEMQLPPCHTLAQWYVSQRKDENGLQYLDCKMYQRSADYLLGVPFNIAQYALITEMLAHTHGLRARFLYHTIGDAHLYQNHIDEGFVEEIVNRPIIHKSAMLHIDRRINSTSILDIQVKDVTLVGYESYEAQKNVPIAK